MNASPIQATPLVIVAVVTIGVVIHHFMRIQRLVRVVRVTNVGWNWNRSQIHGCIGLIRGTLRVLIGEQSVLRMC